MVWLVEFEVGHGPPNVCPGEDVGNSANRTRTKVAHGAVRTAQARTPRKIAESRLTPEIFMLPPSEFPLFRVVSRAEGIPVANGCTREEIVGESRASMVWRYPRVLDSIAQNPFCDRHAGPMGSLWADSLGERGSSLEQREVLRAAGSPKPVRIILPQMEPSQGKGG